MPQVTVFVRKADIEKWRALENKAEWLHEKLSGIPDAYLLTPKLAQENPRLVKRFDEITATLKTAETNAEANSDIIMERITATPERWNRGKCKDHGFPLDDRGRCTQKKCKYA